MEEKENKLPPMYDVDVNGNWDKAIKEASERMAKRGVLEEFERRIDEEMKKDKEFQEQLKMIAEWEKNRTAK